MQRKWYQSPQKSHNHLRRRVLVLGLAAEAVQLAALTLKIASIGHSAASKALWWLPVALLGSVVLILL